MKTKEKHIYQFTAILVSGFYVQGIIECSEGEFEKTFIEEHGRANSLSYVRIYKG